MASESADQVLRAHDFSLTLREYLQRHRYPQSFGPEFIYPFLSASWGAPIEEMPNFPILSLLKDMRRSPGRKAGTYEIDGGMSRYMQAFGQKLTRTTLRLGVGVRRIHENDGFVVEDAQGQSGHFDRLILATSARDAAKLLLDVPSAAPLVAVVRCFRHFETEIVIHGDPSFMPPRRQDWAMVNLFHEGDHAWMTDWSGWRNQLPVFRTWMPPRRSQPTPLYCRRTFYHLLMTPENETLQRRIAALQGRSGIFLVGMYTTDTDNHESALLSALVPAHALSPHSPALHRLIREVRKT